MNFCILLKVLSVYFQVLSEISKTRKLSNKLRICQKFKLLCKKNCINFLHLKITIPIQTR